MTVTAIKEISFAQKLADVDNSVRMHALHKLQKFINYKSSIEAFTLDDLKKIWKGLYYCMYMADMPLVQEALADDIAKLIEEFKNRSQVFLFIEAAFETFVREWDGIDKFRMDKFMMLFTRFFRLSLIFLRQNRWNMEEVGKLVKLMETIIICPSDNTNTKPLGLKMHLTDIVLDELAKIGTEILPNEVTITFLYPFFKVLVVSKQNRFIKYVETKIFEALVRVSDLGIRNHDDLLLEELEAAKEDEDDEDCKEIIKKEEPLDPRAGGVDVYIPQLKPNYAQIADILTSLGGLEEINQYKRNLLYKYVNIFLDLEMGVYPFAKLETSEQTVNSSILNKEEEDGDVKETEKKSAEVRNVKKLKLGDNGSVIKKNWKRLQKKTPEDKRKELKKANLNGEVAVNKVLLNLAVRNKIPNNFYISSNSIQNIETKNDKNKKKKKVQKPKSEGNGSLKLASLNEESDKSPVKRKKSKIDKKSEIDNVSKENTTHFTDNVQKMQNKLSTKINMISEKSQKNNLMGNEKDKFEIKIGKQSESNDSLKLASLNGKLEKSPVEKRRKRRRKSGKNSGIDNVAVENTKQSTLNINVTQNMESNKINVVINKSHEMMSNKDNLIGNKKGTFKKIVNQPEVNGTLKLSSLDNKGEKSLVGKRRKRKPKSGKISEINNTANKNAKQCANIIQKPQNQEVNKIKRCIEELPSQTNVSGNKKGKFEIKTVTLSDANKDTSCKSSLALGSFNGNKVKKSSVEKKKKLSSIPKNTSINNLKEKNKNSMKCDVELSNIANLSGSKKRKLESTNALNASYASGKKNPAFLSKKLCSSPMNMVIKTQKVNTKGKLLKINLRQNTIHDVNHYRNVLSSSPGIPYSADKKPNASVLKATPPTTGRKKFKKPKRLQELSKKFNF